MKKSVLDSYYDNRFYRLNTLKIKIKDACNLRCKMCEHWRKSKKVEETSTDQILETLNEAASLGCRQLTLTGGEPTLNGDLEKIFACAKQNNMRTNLLTNGYRVTSTRLSSLVASGLDKISVSIDCSRADMHDDIRGIQGAFQQSMEFLRECTALRRSDSNLYEVSMTTCVLKPNLNSFPDLVELAKHSGVDVFSIIIIDAHNKGGESLTPSAKEKNIFQKQTLPVLKKLCRKSGLKFRSSGISECYGLSSKTEIKDLPCYFPWANATIAVNGDVYPCCDLIDVPTACLGNINNTRLGDILNSTQAHNVRQLTNERKLPICNKCYWEHEFNLRVNQMNISRKGSLTVAGENKHERI